MNEEFLVSASQQLALITVPALCTHRPSLLPIEWFSEDFGLRCRRILRDLRSEGEKLDPNLIILEEVKVVTRFP